MSTAKSSTWPGSRACCAPGSCNAASAATECGASSTRPILDLHEAQAADLGGLGRRGIVNLAGFGIIPDHASGPDHTIVCDTDPLRDRGIDPDHAVLPDPAKSRHHDMGSDVTVVLDHRAMADDVAALQDHIVADRDQMLDHVVLEDEHVVADRRIAPHQ